MHATSRSFRLSLVCICRLFVDNPHFFIKKELIFKQREFNNNPLKAMKNNKLRTLLFCLIMAASIGSYLYINTIQLSNTHVKCEAKQELTDVENNESNSELPDIKILKKIIEKGKKLIPATQF